MAVAEHLGPRLPVEIVSVDSAQVYIGMDIGTAKPGPAERAAVPHHLIDIVDPAEVWSAARFVESANRLIGEITSRGALPLLVGGTMLYFKALIDGLDAMPAADAGIRAGIDRQAEAEGWPALHAELARVDAVTAARLAPNDAQRIQRALEVWLVSGKPLSAWHATTKRRATPPPLIALEPADRGWLHRRIDERLTAMLDAGFVDEVRGLRERGDLHADLPSMRAVGYRQAWAALDAGELSKLHAAAAAATRQLARRQLTWLRAMPERRVVACDARDATKQVAAAVAGLAANAR